MLVKCNQTLLKIYRNMTIGNLILIKKNLKEKCSGIKAFTVTKE